MYFVYTTNHPRFQPSQLSHCQERKKHMDAFHHPPRYAASFTKDRIYSPCCAASIAVQHGDAGRFVKAVKAEKSNEIL
jgi:hypothetical protein